MDSAIERAEKAFDAAKDAVQEMSQAYRAVIRLAGKQVPASPNKKRERNKEKEEEEELSVRVEPAVESSIEESAPKKPAPAPVSETPFACPGRVWKSEACIGGKKSGIKDGIMVPIPDSDKRKRYTICRECKLVEKKEQK